jgi:hypothetical protein
MFALLLAGPALASPLDDSLAANGDALCFERTGAAPAGQQWREARLSFVRAAPGDAPRLRLQLQGADRPYLIYAACTWHEGDINRGAGGRVLDPTFLPTSGVTCFLSTDDPDEEAGSFPTAWAGGRSVEVHLPATVPAWRDWDGRKRVTWASLAAPDRILSLNGADPSACADLNRRFVPER